MWKINFELEGMDKFLNYYFASHLKEKGYLFTTGNYIDPDDDDDWYAIKIDGQNPKHYFDGFEMEDGFYVDWFDMFESLMEIIDKLFNESDVQDYCLRYSSRYEILVDYEGDLPDFFVGFDIYRTFTKEVY